MNGYPRVRETFAHVEGYVEDIMAYAPYLTVREGIEYSAAMRLSKKVQAKERKHFCQEVIVFSNSDFPSSQVVSVPSRPFLNMHSQIFCNSTELGLKS